MKKENQIVSRLSRSDRSAEDQATREQEYTIKPRHEINEVDDAWKLTVFLPGVTKDKLEITVEDGMVVVRGHRDWIKPVDWTAIYRESLDASFRLELEHGNEIAVDKIHAEFNDGILAITLPKTEAIKPRKIAVN